MKQNLLDEELMQDALQWLLRFQSPELGEQEKKEFFVWLEQSLGNQQAYIEAEAYWEKLGNVSTEASGKVHEDAPADKNVFPLLTGTTTRRPRPNRWHAPAIVASILLFAGLLLSIFFGFNDIRNYRSVVGERQQIILSDGSEVWLNTDSSLRVESMFMADARIVHLDSGEALFNVVSDPSRPFIVYTVSGAVRVLGTQFSVRAEGNETLVTVREGKVALFDGPAEQPIQSLTTLVADQQLSIAQAAQGLGPKQVDAKAITAWQQGRLVYRGVPLGQVVADLSLYFDGDISLGDDALQNTEVVAVIKLQDKASTLAALESVFDIVVVNQSATSTVLYSKQQYLKHQ